MSDLIYEYFELEDMNYSGYEVEIFLPEIEKVDFGKLWGSVIEKSDFTGFTKEMFTVGFEDYDKMTRDNQTFIYKALVPSEFFNGDDGVRLTLKKGKYIKFKSLFKDHGPAFFQKMYKFMDDNKIKYEKGFDFEIMYGDFEPEDDNAYCYVGLKLV